MSGFLFCYEYSVIMKLVLDTACIACYNSVRVKNKQKTAPPHRAKGRDEMANEIREIKAQEIDADTLIAACDIIAKHENRKDLLTASDTAKVVWAYEITRIVEFELMGEVDGCNLASYQEDAYDNLSWQ